jgi:hypothetical protein
MTRTQAAIAALACALSFPAWPAGPGDAQAAPPSPYGMDPAKVEYLRNDAPFVVFDVSPRQLDPGRDGKAATVLNFIATEDLQLVKVFASPRIAGQASSPFVDTATRCGAVGPGYHSCEVRTADALAWLGDREGHVELRIEAEGLDDERSEVRITLPVAASARTAPQGSAPPHTLTLLAFPPAR